MGLFYMMLQYFFKNQFNDSDTLYLYPRGTPYCPCVQYIVGWSGIFLNLETKYYKIVNENAKTLKSQDVIYTYKCTQVALVREQSGSTVF